MPGSGQTIHQEVEAICTLYNVVHITCTEYICTIVNAIVFLLCLEDHRKRTQTIINMELDLYSYLGPISTALLIGLAETPQGRNPPPAFELIYEDAIFYPR